MAKRLNYSTVITAKNIFFLWYELGNHAGLIAMAIGQQKHNKMFDLYLLVMPLFDTNTQTTIVNIALFEFD